MGTYVVLVNERPESRAALDWASTAAHELNGHEGRADSASP